MSSDLTHSFLLPAGTRVVLLVDVRRADVPEQVYPGGTVGEVLSAPADPSHNYRVRFLDGGEAVLKRREMTVLTGFQATPASPMEGFHLERRVIFRCVVGSRAYGLDTDASDTDRRGIYLPPASLHWSLFGVPEQIENHQTQETYWELQKFLTLALKANPNVLECLHTPLVEHATPLAQELLAERKRFLSKLVFQTYSGYVWSQFKKLQADLRNQHQVKWKHVMHLIRLLLSGIEILRSGEVMVRVDRHRPELLSIRRGEVPFDEVERQRLALHEAFEAAYRTTALPDRPDYSWANAFLIRARKSVLDV